MQDQSVKAPEGFFCPDLDFRFTDFVQSNRFVSSKQGSIMNRPVRHNDSEEPNPRDDEDQTSYEQSDSYPIARMDVKG
jgi:hypothetical protein